MNWKYIENFEQSRESRIGGSEIIWCIPHPEKQIESLGAYTDEKGVRHACTALDLYDVKINKTKRQSGFPAEMGHFIEVKSIYEFIKDNIDYDVAFEFQRGYNLHKMEQDFLSHKSKKKIYVNPEPYNNTDFKHNTESIIEGSVSHADCIYIPDKFIKDKKESEIKFKKNGMTFDLSKPFIIEAKSANYHAVQARKKDQYVGYDMELRGFQGLPLKVYFQVQFQMALYKIEMAYVSLIYNTNSKHYWQIKANPKHQAELMQIAQYMKKCIDTKTPPKKLLMNSKDIAKLYPEIKEDFRELKDDELHEVLQIATEYYNAKQQSDIWGKKEKDLRERFSIHLKDTETIKGYVSGSLQTIAKWKYTGGGKRILGLKKITEREDGKKLLKYFERNKLIQESEKNKIPDVVIRAGELEEIGGEE